MVSYRRLSTFLLVYRDLGVIAAFVRPVCCISSTPLLLLHQHASLLLLYEIQSQTLNPWDRMNSSEITEEKGDEDRIRRIIEYQKSLYQSSSASSSFSSSAASCSSFSSVRRSNSLLGLMKVGNASLRRLFDMEHTSLANHFEDFSGSSVIKPILLWGSDTDNENETYDPWQSIKRFEPVNDSRIDGPSKFPSDGSFLGGDRGFRDREVRIRNRKLTRKKSFRRLPGFGLWRCRGFRFRLRLKLRRLRIAFCGRKC